MDNETTIRDSENIPVIQLRGVAKYFDDSPVLAGIDLEVRKGENMVVLGKSGSGKTTLIKCVIRLIVPDEGEICVFGKDLASLGYAELNEIRKKMGFLFQNAALYDSMTVFENLAFPIMHHQKDIGNEEMEGMIREVLDSVGLAEAEYKMPAELSGGMSKRIGLARALVLKPEIMLYDEPTSGLDTATAREISQLILDLQEKNNISSMIITHDMACAKLTADRIVVLKDGTIAAEGKYEELGQSKDDWVRSFF
jgi:phospholipid/cholesterol/gamma-HCH transport system ATP-binding protein